MVDISVVEMLFVVVKGVYFWFLIFGDCCVDSGLVRCCFLE